MSAIISLLLLGAAVLAIVTASVRASDRRKAGQR